MVAAPIRREGAVLGSIYNVRLDLRPFTPHQVATLEAFAAQAANAIETARAQRALAERNREISEALERQTATAQVLDVISRSPADLQAALDAIALQVRKLLASDSGAVIRIRDGAEERVSPFPIPADARHSQTLSV